MVSRVGDVISAGFDHGILSIDEDGCVWFSGSIGCFGMILHPYRKFQRVNIGLYRMNIPNVQIKTMSASLNHWVGIDSSGKAWGLGDNSSYELGVNSSNSILLPVNIPICEEVVSVICGFRKTFFISKNGKVYGCGSNARNCLGIPHGFLFNKNIIKSPTEIPELNNIVQIACNRDNSIFLMESGDIIVSGTVIKDRILYKSFEVIATKSNITNVKNIACGNDKTMVQTNDDEIFIVENRHILYKDNPIPIGITSRIQNIYAKYNGLILESNNTL